jgi:hypothetical protein
MRLETNNATHAGIQVDKRFSMMPLTRNSSTKGASKPTVIICNKNSPCNTEATFLKILQIPSTNIDLKRLEKTL